MRTQLALLKHTIAFALYIDETLAIDLTDPHAMTILTQPVTVYPSGVSYSLATVKKLFHDVQGEPGERLPTVDWLASHGGGAAAAETAIGAHAKRCFTALGRG